ncbi:tetratricopeptide repeat protein [Persicobacter diffluens]|uniref:Tetratricopeptide repeat protein n=1 Tax=Persicobacter diffluens TaxID=981 RepID=A0AAN4VWY2_9BACT|nr:hypothetical protein PEDI_15040 [Persicobacter diffluens]
MKFIKLLFILFCVSIFSWNAVAQNTTEAQKFIDQGLAAFDNGALEDAEKAFSAAAEKDLKNAGIYMLRGMTREAMDNGQGALDDYNMALNLNPEDTVGYVVRGQLRMALGNNDGAVMDFTKALDLDDEMPEAYRSRGMVYYFQNNYRLALSDFQEALLLEADDASDYFYIGICLRELGDNARAVGFFNTCLLFDEENAEVYYQRGLANNDLLFVEEACSDFRKAYQLGMTDLKELLVEYCGKNKG